MARTHYEVLGVERGASSTDIEAAYRELALAYRDHTYAGTDSLEDIREAYRVLSNTGVRADYDQTLPRLRVEPRKGGAPGWMKWALPFGLVGAIAIGYVATRKPAGLVTMNVGPIKRIEVASTNDDDPTRPAPVTIPPAAPLEGPSTVTVSTAPGLPLGRGSAEDVFAAVSPSIARVLVMDAGGKPVSQGSGVVVSPGVVVTNCHVTRDSKDISVKVGREEYRAAPLSSDEEHDLCRLSISGLPAPAVTLGSASQLKTGQRVFAIGAPQGLELTISEGIVSSLRPVADGTMIQTSAPISPGSSGGGLFDASGRLVGVVTFQHKFGQNLNFAVPADWVAEGERK